MNIRDLGGPGRTGYPAGSAERSKGNPAPSDIERLEQALRKSEDRGKNREPSERERQKEAAEGQTGSFSGAAILRGLQGPEGGAAEAIPGQADVEARLEALSEIADRLLVSEPGSADKEIRILIKESLLPGAEIRLTLKDGAVGVNFICQNEQSALFLERHKAELEQRLGNRLGEAPEVLVRRETPEDQDGRSR
ncbi:MAG: hypothetical protein LBC90_08795, partial [Candidatus Adiutrix sp.]|nr:hypothetical protein [Candidatus Adiutrix sp.]